MKVDTTERFTAEAAASLYGLTHWGNGYFQISPEGRLLFLPTRRGRGVDLFQVIQDLRRTGVRTPVMLRFPQALQTQLGELCGAFHRAIDEFGYLGGYRPLYPVKVNQRVSVVRALLEGGKEYGLGLEVGSRAELLAASALPLPPGGQIVCNGFKDRGYLEAASLVARAGLPMVTVLEKPFELDRLLELAGEGKAVPDVGFRIRLQAKGSGLWEKSGGFASKFGLTTLELIRAVERLTRHGIGDKLRLLHFHVGSQVTEIRKIKYAVREAAHIYAKLYKSGHPVQYLDVGGGLGIDYDGSRTSSDASVNYSVQEYANDVVFGIQEVCEREQVPMPCILTESGRMLTAYHAVLVTDVLGTISPVADEPAQVRGDEPQAILDLAEVERTITVKNYREYYHDALEYRDQMYALFNLGMLDLEDRAKGESLFWKIARKAVVYSKSSKFVAEEFAELETRLRDRYICNFSVFQSLPDHWALDQLFPVVPLHRLDEPPTRKAALVDITCDSDGEVDKFVDVKEIKRALEVHPVREGEPYYLAFALVGAYQDTMGDMHNLYGTVNEAEVLLDPDGSHRIGPVRNGDRIRDTLRYFDYADGELEEAMRGRLQEAVRQGRMDEAEARTLFESYRRRMDDYTYLG